MNDHYRGQLVAYFTEFTYGTSIILRSTSLEWIRFSRFMTASLIYRLISISRCLTVHDKRFCIITVNIKNCCKNVKNPLSDCLWSKIFSVSVFFFVAVNVFQTWANTAVSFSRKFNSWIQKHFFENFSRPKQWRWWQGQEIKTSRYKVDQVRGPSSMLRQQVCLHFIFYIFF